MLTFYSFRLNLIQPQFIQTDFFNDFKPKEERFKNVLAELEAAQKTSFLDYGSKYFIFFENTLLDNVYAYQLAREEVYVKPIEGEAKIEQVQDTRLPYVFVIIDAVKQIVLIQEKTSVFNEIGAAKNRIETFFQERLAQFDITVFLKPMTDKQDFWKEVETLDEIEEFDITLNAPNLFGGRFKATEVVKQTQESYNATEVEVKLKNKERKLRLLKEQLEDFVAYAAAGAGKYIVKAYKNGTTYIINSMKRIIKRIYDVEVVEEIPKETLREDLDTLDKLNDEQPK